MDKKILSAICKGADMAQRWFVEVYEIDCDGKKTRRRVYGGINRFKNVKARQAAAEKIIKQLCAPAVALPDSDYYAVFCGALMKFGISMRKKSKQTFQSKIDIFCKWLESQKEKTIDKKTVDDFVYYLQSEQKHKTTRIAANTGKAFEF
jgi:disulfide oxidoreductase YuzD